MRKLKISALAIALAIVCVFTMVGCKGYVGTFHLKSMEVKMGGLGSITINTGEEYLGMVINPESFVITVNKDGTAKIATSIVESLEGDFFWKEAEAKNTIILVKNQEDEEGLNLVYEDKQLKLQIAEEGLTVTFTKQ